MCCPTFSARAVTAVNLLQSSDEQTANFRRLPGVGGPTGCGARAAVAAAGAPRARAAELARAAPVRPMRRNVPSNAADATPGAGTAPTYRTAGIATCDGAM